MDGVFDELCAEREAAKDVARVSNHPLAIRAVQDELARQIKLLQSGKFSFTCATQGIPEEQKLAILAEEFGEVSKEVMEIIISDSKDWPGEDAEMVLTHQERVRKRRKGLLRTELIQVAAVAVAWISALNEELGDA